MNTGVVSRRYAKALLDFAMDRGNEDKIYEEVKTLARHFANVPDLRRTIDNPVVTMKRFLLLVLNGKREKFLQFMTWSYIDLYRERKHILMGKLTTAIEAPELVKKLEKIASKKTNSKIEITSKVDPSIIGGYIMEIDGYRLDASVDYQLKKVKRQFIEKNRRIV